MLVAKDSKHQQKLYDALVKQRVAAKEDIFMLSTGDSIFLTDDAVEEGEDPRVSGRYCSAEEGRRLYFDLPVCDGHIGLSQQQCNPDSVARAH